MRSARYHGLRDVRVESIPEPTILKGSDALVRVTKAGICGSDLHFFNNGPDLGMEAGTRLGHEFVGVVEAVGGDVTGVKVGDRVVAPFVFSDGSCFFCDHGIHSSCTSGGIFGSPFWGEHAGGEVEGGQSEFVRVPEADGTLVVIPEALAAGEHDLAVLPLGDVFATGYHGAVQTGVTPGDTVVVIGDGAVGLCAVQAAALKGAAAVVLLGHHQDRVAIGMANGATHTAEGGDEAAAVVQELSGGRGADAVIDSISGDASIKQAISLVRDGGAVSMLGMSHYFQPVEQPISGVFMRNVSLHPGVAPTRAYIPELLPEVERGTINPGVVFTHDLPLEDAPKGFEIMDSRAEGSIKVALTP
ncbi:MAG: alcohol dehydrogenase catalytic domain-containing protein [Thermoleophilia bacterium]